MFIYYRYYNIIKIWAVLVSSYGTWCRLFFILFFVNWRYLSQKKNVLIYDFIQNIDVRAQYKNNKIKIKNHIAYLYIINYYN